MVELKVVAMGDKWNKKDKHRHYDNVTYPALNTYGIITGYKRYNTNVMVLVKTQNGDTIKYKACELEPLEILKDIHGEYKYRRALDLLA